ncbi:MAG: PIG-L family deacetylase [Candidatus Krumholzibacteriota bacterium]|nr:PIG-L family deacetylase [Candidatus Krumholzibacteriota bacterium]
MQAIVAMLRDEFYKKNKIIVVAHPDDEAIACGNLILKTLEQGFSICVIRVTKGAPYYLNNKERELVVNIRENEASKFDNLFYSYSYHSVNLSFIDQYLSSNVSLLYHSLKNIVVKNVITNSIIISHHLEFGHPDHDLLYFIVRKISKDLRFNMYSFPMYGTYNGRFYYEYSYENLNDVVFKLNNIDVYQKSQLLNIFKSQKRIIERINTSKEVFIPVEKLTGVCFDLPYPKKYLVSENIPITPIKLLNIWMSWERENGN